VLNTIEKRCVKMMDPVPLVLGVLALLSGCVFKVVLDWESIGPSAPADRRGPALFRQFFLAPDIVTFSFGLLLSSKGIHGLLARHEVTSPLGDKLPAVFSSLVYVHVIVLLVVIALWFAAGERKYIPVAPKQRPTLSLEGERVLETVPSPMILKGVFTTRAGFLALILGNLLGCCCLASYVGFMFKAFHVPV
jgi:hypothetical protein